MRRSVRKFVIAAAAAILLAGGAGTAKADAPALGNSSENILNGGVLASDTSGRSYFSDPERRGSLYASNGRQTVRVTADQAGNINVIGGYIYYTVDSGSGSKVYRIPAKGGVKTKCFAVKKPIKEMYVDSEGTFYFLAGGNVYTRGAEDKNSSVSVKDGRIKHFIPTEYGMILAKGSDRRYTVYAGTSKIRSNVTKFYTYDDYLILSVGGKDYQAKIHDLFHGSASAAVEAYSFGNKAAVLKVVSAAMHDDGDCDVCRENAAEAARTGIQAADASPKLDRTAAKSILDDDSVSDGQRNMVKRARQQHEIKWTAQSTIKAWTGTSSAGMSFYEGTTYQGLPYGQPTRSGKYTPWGFSLDQFAEAAADPTSLMYTARGSNGGNSSPYYSCDCSSFVSWAWDLPSRQWTGSIGGYANVVSTRTVYGMEIGDALVYSGHHVVMISDIGYENGTPVYVDIIEQTPPSTKLTRWGQGGSKSLAEMYTKYFVRNSYIVIRSKTRDSVTYTPSDAVPLDGDGEDEDGGKGYIKMTESSVDLAIGASKKLTYTKSDVSGQESWSSSDSGVASVSGGTVTAVSAGKAKITLTIGSASASCNIYVKPGKTTLVKAKTNSQSVNTLKWNKVSGATAYQVYRKSASEDWRQVGTSTSVTYKDSATDNNKTYTYKVRSVYTADNRTIGADFSNEMSVKTMPAAPKLISVETVTTGSQKITWGAVAGASGYRVFVKEPGDAFYHGIWNTTSTYHTATGLTCGVKYTYTVRAYVGNPDDWQVGDYDHDGISKVCVPSAVKNLSASSVKYGTITLNWDKVSGATAYKVYRTKKNHFEPIATVSGDSFTDKKLSAGKKYRYRVRAVVTVDGKEVVGEFEGNGLAAICRLSAPKLKSVSSTQSRKAKFSWNSLQGADGYRIMYKIKGGRWKVLTNVSKKTTSFTAKGLKSKKTYYLSVSAYWKKGSRKYYGDYDSKGLAVKVK